jgi:peptidoglycan/LPS O-acetylase OafA/YrhL
MAASPKPEFRNDLQGLRAIAVLFVLLFHAGVPGLQGGFIGVDVFFVLSGFLITGNLLRESIKTGTISLQNFYAKRIRRLLPASLLVLFATLVGGYYFLPPVLIPDLSRDISAAVLYISNLSFAHQATDYFAANATPSPVLHFWSLGVEEQFYIFWPIFILLLVKIKIRPRISIRFFSIIAFVASLTYANWLLPRSQPWAFFSLPTRSWELALGAILATLVSSLKKLNYLIASIAGATGIALVIGSGFLIRDATKFPGTFALLPTIGAALIIISGAQHRETLSSNLLSLAPMRYLGKISYSLYLWHWPIFVIPLIALSHPLNWPIKIGLLIAVLILSALTERFIEKPIKTGRLSGAKSSRTFTIALISMALVISSALGIKYLVLHAPVGTKPATTSAKPKPSPTGPTRPISQDFAVPTNLTPSLFNAKNDRSINYADRCHTQLNLLPTNAPCLYGDLTSKTTVALFGDSHALAWFPAFNSLAKTNHWKLFSQTMSSCNPADIKAWSMNTNSEMKNCPKWRVGAIAKIIARKPLFVLIGGTRGFRTLNASGVLASAPDNHLIWDAGMKRTIDKFKGAGIKVILMSDVPTAAGDPVLCLSAHPDSSLACANPVAKAIDPQWLATERKVASDEGVPLIELQMWVCPSDPCPVIINNTLVYFDSGHLTATFSRSLAGKLGLEIKKALLTHA